MPSAVHLAADVLDQTVERVTDSLTDSAQGIVAARNELSSMDDAGRAANSARLEAALEDWNGQMTMAHESLGKLHDAADQLDEQMHHGIEAAHAYAATHPDAMVTEGFVCDTPDVQQAVQQEAAYAEA